MTAPGLEGKMGDRHPELGESWSWEGPRLELESHRAGSHLLLEREQRRVGMLIAHSSRPAASQQGFHRRNQQEARDAVCRVLLPGAPSRMENGSGDKDQPPLDPSWGLFNHRVANSSLVARKGDGEGIADRGLQATEPRDPGYCAALPSPAELRGP